MLCVFFFVAFVPPFCGCGSTARIRCIHCRAVTVMKDVLVTGGSSVVEAFQCPDSSALVITDQTIRMPHTGFDARR